jgi:hypothetical protein
MAFIVEDGTGLSNANSYVAVQEYRDYYTDRGIDKASETDDQIQGYLVQGTEFIDLTYCFCGEKLVGTQALQFPRLIDDVDVGVPTQVKYATIIMGNNVSSLSTGGSLYIDSNQNISRNKEKVGPIETDVTYTTGGDRKNTTVQSWYPEVTRYLDTYTCDDGLGANQRRVLSG